MNSCACRSATRPPRSSTGRPSHRRQRSRRARRDRSAPSSAQPCPPEARSSCAGGSLANAASVGAKTVNGPLPLRVSTRPAAVRAFARVLNWPAPTAVSTMSARSRRTPRRPRRACHPPRGRGSGEDRGPVDARPERRFFATGRVDPGDRLGSATPLVMRDSGGRPGSRRRSTPCRWASTFDSVSMSSRLSHLSRTIQLYEPVIVKHYIC